MKLNKLIIIISMMLLIITSFAFAKTMIVRVYVQNWNQLRERIDFKQVSIDIAGGKPNQWYDLVVSTEDYPLVAVSGLRNEIRIQDLDAEKERVLLQYHSFDSTNLYIRNLVNTYPTLCVLDSLGLSYENRQMYGIKISDNPGVSEPNEPGVFICGLHHSREWATPLVCIFFAESILSAYNSSPAMQNLINNHEIWIFPMINPDGYVYDYPAHRSWRKNRQPFGGSIGTDINRNYNGACTNDRFGWWGALTSGSNSDHNPSSLIFMGAYGMSSPEITNVRKFFMAHDINVSLSYHSYSELVLWPWAYQNIPTPDNALYVRVGTTMANMIQALGGGYYTPEQTPGLYPVSSGYDDWIYGWNRSLNGVPCLSLTTEVGTDFYQPTTDLSSICRQNFKAAYFLANFSDSVRILVKPLVPPAQVVTQETSFNSNFTVSWQPKNVQYTNPNLWELQELKDYSVYADSFEGISSNWTLQGFMSSTRRAHSGTKSMYSDSANNISNYIRTTYPYLVHSGDSLTFWCWYNLEKNYDVAVAEVSFDTKEWFQLGARLTDTAMSWRRKAYSLEPYAGKSVYIQFRVMTDDGVLKNGFYLDDVNPVPLFGSSRIISSAITDTFYDVSVPQAGQYWYRVKGNNLANGWGDYSILKGVTVLSSSVTDNTNQNLLNKISLNIYPNPFFNSTVIRYTVPSEGRVNLKVFDVQGRNVADLINNTQKPGQYRIIWSGRNTQDKHLSAGVYFLELNINRIKLTKRVIVF